MFAAMENRRANSTTERTSPDTDAPLKAPVERSQIGITIWFDTMVDRLMAATITIDVAEENPPRNDSIARPFCPCDSGSVSTKRSGLEPCGNSSSPSAAIGTTKIEIRSR